MRNKHYIVFDDGRIGYIKSICTCDKCKERHMAEVFINDLDDEYMDCIKANDEEFKTLLYFGNSLSDAISVVVKSNDKTKEIEYLQSLIDFYSSELVEGN